MARVVALTFVLIGTFLGPSRLMAQEGLASVARRLDSDTASLRVGAANRLWEAVRAPDAPARWSELEETTRVLLEVAATGKHAAGRSFALGILLGSGEYLPRPLAEFDRIVQLYDVSRDPGVRGTVLQRAPDQPERGKVLTFLEREATSSDESLAPVLAIEALSRSGAQGRSVLERLHRDGSVRNGEAKAFLRELSGRGFRPGG